MISETYAEDVSCDTSVYFDVAKNKWYLEKFTQYLILVEFSKVGFSWYFLYSTISTLKHYIPVYYS